MPHQKPAKPCTLDRASVAMRVYLAARAVTNPPLPSLVERAALEIADTFSVTTREQAVRALDLAWSLVRPVGEEVHTAPVAALPVG